LARRYDAWMTGESSHPPTEHERRPRAGHDLGGVSKFMCLPVDIEPHELTDFDREVDAIRQLLDARGVMSVDELRRGIEAIPEADYHRLSYYQRWIRSIADNLIRKGVVTAAELQAAMAAT
jgi:hypothetical protein